MATGHVSKFGQKVSVADWEFLREDEEYCLIDQFLNNRFTVTARWHGIVRDINKKPKEYWTPFELQVSNRIEKVDSEGQVTFTFVRDPLASEEYNTADEALDAYRGFLSRYTNSGWRLEKTGEIANYVSEEEESTWVEPDNELKDYDEWVEPEIPDDPKPIGSMMSGSW
ncbi:MAG: hypothetical protein HRT93_03345 [Piscirickettsiaceae bacterium]|nr:hypothetical protein [Piscirickettsiaceae bacterium]